MPFGCICGWWALLHPHKIILSHLDEGKGRRGEEIYDLSHSCNVQCVELR